MAKRRGRPPKSYIKERQSSNLAGRWKQGHLHLLDELPLGSKQIVAALNDYTHPIEPNRQSRHWARTVPWVENILFSLGRQYIDDVLISRLAADSDGENLSSASSVGRQIPKPTNDYLGRYIETNIALLTENRPRPRVTSKSERREDQTAAELSELTLEYLWEALKLPELHREAVRMLLCCGTCWMEYWWDPSQPRHFAVPATTTERQAIQPGIEGAPPVTIPITREVTAQDKQGRTEYKTKIEYGDITARLVSPFEMHIPVEHWWNGRRMGWVMREEYSTIEQFQDHYGMSEVAKQLSSDKGWYLDRLDDIKPSNIRNLPLWWWEKMADLVEGPGPSLYVGSPDEWDNNTLVRWIDRKPNPRWPKGRSILIAGDQVIYDSPKDIGARVYDDRWPDRWHPYVRMRWEPMFGSIYGRSLLSKLLPKIKRINSIDTVDIMYRRTVPIAGWLIPKGSHPVTDLWTGKPGFGWEYDARRTAGKSPEPIYPPSFPESILKEREIQVAEMESIAGTEEILRGQRPTGTTNAAMLEILRKQALASRSATLQAWDESLQEGGGALLQETIKHVRDDPRYAERLRILAREKHSRLTIQNFSGTDLSDNIVVRVDTASMALVSKEAQEAKALEFAQYAPGLMQLPLQMRQAVMEKLGYDKILTPQGPDVERAKMFIQQIKQGTFERLIPLEEDDPYVFVELLSNEMKADSYWDLSEEQQAELIKLVDTYKKVIQAQEEARSQMMLLEAQKQGGQG